MLMLTPIAENVLGFEQDLRLPGGMRLPSRTTIVRLASGGLVVHSPLGFDAAAAKAIDDLGEVKAIVAPSCIHYFFLKAATERWPKARVLGAPGLEKKVRGLPFEALPHDGAIRGLGDDGELELRRIDGVPYMTEHVFLHRPSRSLVVTDLLFNVRHSPSFMTRMFLRFVSGAYGTTAQSRMWRWFTKDAAAAAESANAVLAWDFERVVVAHGEVVECDARERARVALAKMTAATPPPKLLSAA